MQHACYFLNERFLDQGNEIMHHLIVSHEITKAGCNLIFFKISI
jgi:hypothetical protein